MGLSQLFSYEVRERRTQCCSQGVGCPSAWNTCRADISMVPPTFPSNRFLAGFGLAGRCPALLSRLVWFRGSCLAGEADLSVFADPTVFGNAVVAIGIAAALAGCGSGGTPAATSTVTATSRVTVTETPKAETTTVPTSESESSPAENSAAESAPAESWIMPNEIGKTLQRAQDDIQALTGNPMFVSTSEDLTGKGRQQIMDRNWQVCSSTPPPGAVFTSQTNVVFGVVRDSESCP